MENVISNISRFYEEGAILVVSNPVDVMVMCADAGMRLPPGRVFGTGCMLDTSRLAICLADYFDVCTGDIKTCAAGEHGEGLFVLWSRTTVKGIPVSDYAKEAGIAFGDSEKETLVNRIKGAGASIISKKGRTHYGIAVCISRLAKCILNNEAITESVSSVFGGEYGIEGVALSVPCVVTKDGVTKRLEEKLLPDELKNLCSAAVMIKNMKAVIK
jgi:L-lactate dehydrogenase